MTTQYDIKTISLAQHLELSPDEVELNQWDQFEADGCEYEVLTDDEAADKITEYAKESVWAFNASFLADMTDLPIEVFEALQGKCEDSNEPILKLIEQSCGLDDFISEAVSQDGRGPFIAHYDHEELELPNNLFAYRVN